MASKNSQRVLSVLEYLQALTKEDSDKETFRILLTDFIAKDSSLQDDHIRESVFKKIERESQESISFEDNIEDVKIANEGLHPTSATLLERTITVHIDDNEIIDKLQRRLLNETGDLNQKLSITKIEILERAHSEKVTVYVNEDYINEKIRPNKKGKYWSVILEIARNGSADHPEASKIADYFNTNSKNILYTQSGCILTEILSVSEKKIFPLIPIKLISKKALSQRKNKMTS